MTLKKLEITGSEAKGGLILHPYGSILETTNRKGVLKYDALFDDEDEFRRFLAFEIGETPRENLLDSIELFSRKCFAVQRYLGSPERLSEAKKAELSSSTSTAVYHFFSEDTSQRGGSDSASQTNTSSALCIEPPKPLNELLAILLDEHADLSARCQAVCSIQSHPIPHELRQNVNDVLLDFIRRYRQSDDFTAIVSVGAAIRKLLLNLDCDQLGVVEELLRSDGVVEIPVEVELEAAKTVLHILKAELSLPGDVSEGLGSVFAEIAELYSRPKLVSRKKYGATALNCLLVVLLLRHKKALALSQHVLDISPEWFVGSAKNRLRRFQKSLQSDPREEASEMQDWLSESLLLND